VSGPGAAVAEIRLRVRRALSDLSRDDTVLVACSGGADSLALAAAAAFVGSRAGLRVGIPLAIVLTVAALAWSRFNAAAALVLFGFSSSDFL